MGNLVIGLFFLFHRAEGHKSSGGQNQGKMETLKSPHRGTFSDRDWMTLKE
jgi:hypothetical protein